MINLYLTLWMNLGRLRSLPIGNLVTDRAASYCSRGYLLRDFGFWSGAGSVGTATDRRARALARSASVARADHRAPSRSGAEAALRGREHAQASDRHRTDAAAHAATDSETHSQAHPEADPEADAAAEAQTSADAPTASGRASSQAQAEARAEAARASAEGDRAREAREDRAQVQGQGGLGKGRAERQAHDGKAVGPRKTGSDAACARADAAPDRAAASADARPDAEADADTQADAEAHPEARLCAPQRARPHDARRAARVSGDRAGAGGDRHDGPADRALSNRLDRVDVGRPECGKCGARCRG